MGSFFVLLQSLAPCCSNRRKIKLTRHTMHVIVFTESPFISSLQFKVPILYPLEKVRETSTFAKYDSMPSRKKKGNDSKKLFKIKMKDRRKENFFLR